MASFNKVILVGNITRDPEVRYTPKGGAVCDLGLAINRKYTTESGEKRDEVTFVDVTTWGKLAEIAGQYCRKGKPVLIEGRLQLDTWDDRKTGQKRSKLRVIGESLQLLGSKDDASDNQDEQHQRRKMHGSEKRLDPIATHKAKHDPLPWDDDPKNTPEDITF